MNENAKMPTKGSKHSAGHDLYATETKTLQPGEYAPIKTGLQIQCKSGTYGRIAPRSGLAIRHGIQTMGGVIDRDFRGQIQIILQNTDKEKEFKITNGDRVAQLIIEKIDESPLELTEELDDTSRATNGFGSTGLQTPPTISVTDNKQQEPPGTYATTSTEPKASSTPKTTRNNTHTSMITTEIWHQRMGHIGLKKLQATAQCTKGIPRIGNLHPQFHCQACAIAKMTKTPRRKKEDQASRPGERFHMDFGFVRGPKNLQALLKRKRTPKHKIRTAKSHHPIKTSHDGYSSYLLITDAASRFTWIFLTKTKEPPIITLNTFMEQHGLNDKTPKFVRTDQGGELARSQAFRNLMAKHNYTVEPTGADNSSQNGRGERPHRTFANMMRCLLYSSNLGSEFWSDALLYSAYLYNRTHHSAIDKTPYEAWTGKQPSLKHIKTFGSPVIAKETGTRATKVDPNAFNGIFLRYTGTSRNIVYYDIHSGVTKTATHRAHDEYQYSSPVQHRTTAANHIINIGKDDKTEGRFGATQLERPITIEMETHAAAAKLVAQPKYTIGTQIQKQFDEETYTGTIIDHDEKRGYYKVQYSDGDEEEMDDEDIDNYLIQNQLQNDITYPAHHTHKETLQLELTLDIFGPSTTVRIPVNKTMDLGFEFQQGKVSPTIVSCKHNTPANTIKRWRSRFRHGTIRAIDGEHIYTIQQFRDIVQELQKKNRHYCEITIAHEEIHNLHTAEGVPQLHFDQLNAIAHHLHAIRNNIHNWEPLTPCPTDDDAEHYATINNIVPVKLTRRIVKQKEDWTQWEQSEFKQHDAYEAQDMFGPPIPPPKHYDEKGNRVNITILPFVWTYLYKDGNKQKARGTCNGGRRYGKAVTLAHTYASCIEQPAARLFYSLAALENMIILGADASNAFAEAPAPVAPLYMKIDEQYRNWWTKHKGREPIPEGWVLPVKHAIQGHPESPRLWEQHINKILKSMGFRNTTHERNIYSNTIDDKKVLFLRQVDDFAVACKDEAICKSVIEAIGKQLTVPLHLLGRITKFNGVDITQTRDYIKISCQTYIDKVLDNHQWQEKISQHNPIPMRDDSKYQTELETATPPTIEEATALKNEHFNYRQAIGEAIYAMVTCRPDISYAVIKLSQYSINPAAIHYKALRHLFRYLALTKARGIHYWRNQPNTMLQNTPPDIPITAEDRLSKFPTTANTEQMFSYVDADWGNDKVHRRSITGMAHMMAGGVIAYKSKYQATVALSSTEAEFTAAAEAGKTILYLRSILYELGYQQYKPTTLYIDNHGALFMANAEQPTRRTRHMDTKMFAIQDWTKEEKLILKEVNTKDNAADHFTKALGRIKFYEQTDIIMGRKRSKEQQK